MVAETQVSVDDLVAPLFVREDIDEPQPVASLPGVAQHTVASLVKEARRLTKGAGAEVVVDFVGVDETLALGAAVGRSMGHLTIVGIGGGSLPISFFGLPYEVSVATTYWGTLPELMEVISLAQAGRIEAKVTRFPLDRATDAYEAMRDGSLDGRAVIVPN